MTALLVGLSADGKYLAVGRVAVLFVRGSGLPSGDVTLHAVQSGNIERMQFSLPDLDLHDVLLPILTPLPLKVRSGDVIHVQCETGTLIRIATKSYGATVEDPSVH